MHSGCGYFYLEIDNYEINYDNLLEFTYLPFLDFIMGRQVGNLDLSYLVRISIGRKNKVFDREG